MKTRERAAAIFFLDDDEPANHDCYEEYVRGFDEVPVLEDAVVIPPRWSAPPSFVRGERRSVRKEERPDGYALREATRAEIELLYGEYLTPKPVKAKRKKPRAAKNSSRKRRGKSRAAG